jgi:ABC-2 type transport system permease protein
MAALLTLIPISAAVILVLAWMLFGLNVEGSLIALIVVVVSGALCMLSIGYFIGSRIRTAIAAAAIMQLVSMSMLFLGGTYFPVDSPPAVMEPLIRVIPLTHLNDALRAVINDGSGLDAIATDLGVLAAWTLATVTVSSRIFRWE